MPDQQTREGLIAIAQCDDRYSAAFSQFDRLNRSGWTMAIFAVECGIYVGRGGRPNHGPHLCVSGADNCGDALTGVIDARGDFYGEPMD